MAAREGLTSKLIKIRDFRKGKENAETRDFRKRRTGTLTNDIYGAGEKISQSTAEFPTYTE